MIPLTLDALLSFMQEAGYKASIQKETSQVSATLELEGEEFPLFLRIYPEETLLQILAFIPNKIKPEALNDTARLLHHLNKELDMPGFGLDENAMISFYRCMIPTPEKKIPKQMLTAYLEACKNCCGTFASVINTVISGTLSYEKLMVKVNEQLQKNAE